MQYAGTCCHDNEGGKFLARQVLKLHARECVRNKRHVPFSLEISWRVRSTKASDLRDYIQQFLKIMHKENLQPGGVDDIRAGARTGVLKYTWRSYCGHRFTS